MGIFWWEEIQLHFSTCKMTSNSKEFAYCNNYKGKNPMTKTQWRKFQRQKKVDALKDITNID